MFDDVCYQKTFLTQVVARIDFVAPLANHDKPPPEKLANLISKDFPITEPFEAIGQEFQIGADGIKSKEARFRQWNFFGKEREKQFIISPQAIMVTYQRYSTYEAMKAEFSRAVEAFAKEYPAARVARFGLRFINNISMDDLPSPFAFDEFLSPALLNVNKFFGSPERLTRLFHVAELKIGEIDVRFQFGFPNPDYPAIIKRPLYVLDMDAYVQVAHELGESIQYMDQAHGEIQQLFEACITDNLRAKMHD
jgi:uncharacterized protein (TIGR04255 family)